MSSMPGNGKTAQAAASSGRIGAPAKPAAPAKKPSVDKPGAKPAGATPPAKGKLNWGQLSDKDRKKLMIGVACLVVGLCVMSVYGYFNWIKKPTYAEPPLNSDAMTMMKFPTTPAFIALPFDRQVIWMNRLGDRKKEMDELFRSGKMSQEEYQDTKAVIWLGKRFKKIADYNSLPEVRRKEFLDELIDKELIEDAEEAKMAETDKLPPRNKDRSKAILGKFPDEHRQAYDRFKKALDKREDERKKEAKAARKAAEAATRPTSRPTERKPG